MLRLKIPSRLPLRVAQINKFHNASPRAQQSIFTRYPTRKDSLYDHKNEKDSCGVGLVAHMKKLPSRQIVLDANEMLVRMSHRGACGCEINRYLLTHALNYSLTHSLTHLLTHLLTQW